MIRASVLWFSTLALAGCHTAPPAAPVEVQVLDAETKAPIDGAQVRMWHSAAHSVVASGTTGPDGMVRIPPPPAEDGPLVFEAMARDYLPRQAGQPLLETPHGVILEMISGPRPVVELVVPNGFRGLIKTRVIVQNDLPYPPHQRLFSFTVPPGGVVEAVVPPIFIRGITPDIRARYADGTPLARDARDAELGCRWLKADPDSDYIFSIGTKWEADEIRRALRKSETGRSPIGEESLAGFARYK